MQCLQSRGINELLLTSDNWEGLRYEGMEGGNKHTTINHSVKITIVFAIDNLLCLRM